MIIHELPNPVRGGTHIQFSAHLHGEGMNLNGVLGTMEDVTDEDGVVTGQEFVPVPHQAPVGRAVVQWEWQEMLQWIVDQGRQTTLGDYMNRDVLAYLDGADLPAGEDRWKL